MPVSTGQTIIATTWLGDANLDGIVNSDDYGFWSNTVSSNPKSYIYGGAKPEWVDGDFDYSGAVDSSDYYQWLNTVTTPGANYDLGFYPRVAGEANVSQQDASGSSAAQDLTVGQGWHGSSVPEPGSLALLMLMAACFAACRVFRGRRFIVSLACLTCFLATLFGGQAGAQSLLVLDYHAPKTFGSVHIAGGAIDITSGAMIVTTSSFGFVPSGGQSNEYGSPGVAEFGDAAIHDAIVEGANFANGFWNGTNGIISSTAATRADGTLAIGWAPTTLEGA